MVRVTFRQYFITIIIYTILSALSSIIFVFLCIKKGFVRIRLLRKLYVQTKKLPCTHKSTREFIKSICISTLTCVHYSVSHYKRHHRFEHYFSVSINVLIILRHESRLTTSYLDTFLRSDTAIIELT